MRLSEINSYVNSTINGRYTTSSGYNEIMYCCFGIHKLWTFIKVYRRVFICHNTIVCRYILLFAYLRRALCFSRRERLVWNLPCLSKIREIKSWVESKVHVSKQSSYNDKKTYESMCYKSLLQSVAFGDTISICKWSTPIWIHAWTKWHLLTSLYLK